MLVEHHAYLLLCASPNWLQVMVCHRELEEIYSESVAKSFTPYLPGKVACMCHGASRNCRQL